MAEGRSATVTWVIDLDEVADARAAAEEAWEIMRRPDSMATVFQVLLEGEIEPVTVDLMETDDEN